MQTGEIKCWLTDKGFGFITSDEGGDVFVHRKALPRGLQELERGVRVSYEVASTDRGLQAQRVQVDGHRAGPPPARSYPDRKRPDVLSQDQFLEEVNTLRDVLPSGFLSWARNHGWVR